jgi:hypothetical protein
LFLQTKIVNICTQLSIAPTENPKETTETPRHPEDSLSQTELKIPPGKEHQCKIHTNRYHMSEGNR